MSKIGSQATHERSQGELSDQNMNIADKEDACEKRPWERSVEQSWKYACPNDEK